MYMVKVATIIALTVAEVAVALPPVADLMQAALILKPRMNASKATSLAIGARAAAKRYNVDPYLLLSIAFQESSFREGLPKGPAGELGVCQVIYSWASNPSFVKEFGHRTEQDFRSVSNSFKYAAWILHTVRKERKASPELPVWTFYNGYAVHARARYFKKVSVHLVAINGGLQ
jgi:hypothetical protein